MDNNRVCIFGTEPGVNYKLFQIINNEYCEQMGADWRKVHTDVLLSGYINDTHTYVPGLDGKFGYGGKCSPKDVNAFAKMTEGTPLGMLLEHLHELNVHFRGVEEHI